jgi:[protein-PII] uridylyltransferase
MATQRDIIDRRQLDETLAARMAEAPDDNRRRAVALDCIKTALADGRAEVRQRFEASRAGGPKAAAELSFLFDQVIRAIHDLAVKRYPSANPTMADRFTVVAVGGYGRGELAPFSDIDLLFLFPYKQTPRGEQVVEFMLYFLWDLGLKVGHSTRSVEDCVRLARRDVTIRTALLEARYLWGDQPLFGELKQRFQDEVVAGTAVEFTDAKLKERDERHQKMGDSRYVVEPNIKDGKGGLRDLQTLYWIGKYVYQVDTVADLVERGVLSRAAERLFAKANTFLWTLRFHLHYLTNRPEERVTFDVQSALAERMSYTDHAGSTGVERFMKHYYLVAKDVGDLTRIFCAAIEAEHKRKPLIRLPKFGRGPDLGPFRLDGDRLTVRDRALFRTDPVAMIRLFHLSHAERYDIHPDALRLVTESLRRIDRKVRNDDAANGMFLDMLTARDSPDVALKRMNEAGVFGRFLPDFGRIVGQTQHDMYHVYTVDEHTIHAIGLLSRIERGLLKEEHPLCSEVVHKVASRRALCVAVLLHDIAKGRGGDHSELGAEIAHELCPRLGLSDEETETVVWLVRYHLAMSSVAQKRDLNDPKTIQDFVDLVQSPERLRLLLCLTVVDMRATGPNVWNNWKAELLRELYYASEDLMSGGLLAAGRKRRVEAAQAELRELLADWSDADFEAHLGRGYPGYWLAFTAETLARQARQIRTAEAEGAPLSVETRVDRFRAVTELTIYTQDHPGLFSRIAGAISAAGANVVDAKIFTTPQGMAIDTFWLQDDDGNAFDQAPRLAKLSVQIERALAGRMKRDEAEAARTFVPARTRVFSVPPRVMIDNQASATHTVIEVNGRDRSGFLYLVTRALYGLALQISTAKISTYGERAVDVFYVKDGFGMKITHEGRLKKIRETLLDAIAEEPAEMGTPAKGVDAAAE